MSRMLARTLTAALLACAAAGCGSTTPAGPSGPPNYDGPWTGTTSQGRTIMFTVQNQKVVALSVGYSFQNCSGTWSEGNLSLPIGTPPNPLVPPPGPGFAYASGSPEQPNYLYVSGFLTTSSAANGSLAFLNYQGCGNAIGIWSASKK